MRHSAGGDTKTRLLSVYKGSETRHLRKLLSEVALGDQRASQLLRRMRDLARTKIPDDTLRVTWTGHLPTAVRVVLAVSDTKDLDNLVAVADKIIKNTRPLMDVNEVTSSMNHAPSASHKSEVDVDRILEEISKLSIVIKGMGRTQPSWHETHGQRSRSRTASRSSRYHANSGGQQGPVERQPTRRRNPADPDWLCFYHLRFRDKARKLQNLKRSPESSKRHNLAHTLDENIPCLDLLSEFPNISKPISFKETPSHSVVHHIETTGPPVFAKARPLQPDRYRRVKEEFQTMMDMGIRGPSKSPWVSPLHIVPKKGRQIRPCGDYRRLNAVTKPDGYPIPRLQDFTYILTKKKIFSRIDISRAYHHISIHEKDIEKTAIITPFGLFDFPRMTFGLRNAAQTFQRFLNHTVLQGLDFLFAYIDDIIIASDDIEQHRRHLKTLFSRLDTYGIIINLSKCAIEKDKIDFLSYEVSTSEKDKTPIDWTPDDERAFEKCKVSLQSAVTLSHPLADAPLGLMTDASNTAVGAVLQQFVNNSWQPLGFYSSKLSDTQQKYSAYDRELLAIYMAIKHFRNQIEGRQLTIYTDHKPITYAFAKIGTDSETPRRTRRLLFISEFTTDIRHVSGEGNAVADALSRVDEITCPTTINFEELSAAQSDDATLTHLLQDTALPRN
ncbi:Retrovirus-related Pol polyprotein from transposon 297 [Eumeta japonica]|uniref:Retrovirus-related Pol polyprotein from transposon 297 n=1 Tax=Eumeta variegata TaxID=151549 RepID=A0A4C1WE43_EUMVA|nr:Retrovirus-related Pol polyprotein from transposon 297 [Eumeta japonica]